MPSSSVRSCSSARKSSCPNGAAPANSRRASVPANASAKASRSSALALPRVDARQHAHAHAPGRPGRQRLAESDARRARDHAHERIRPEVGARRIERRVGVADDAVGARQDHPGHQEATRAPEGVGVGHVTHVHDERHAGEPGREGAVGGRASRVGVDQVGPAEGAVHAGGDRLRHEPHAGDDLEAEAAPTHAGRLAHADEAAGHVVGKAGVDAEALLRRSGRSSRTATTVRPPAACGAGRTRRRPRRSCGRGAARAGASGVPRRGAGRDSRSCDSTGRHCGYSEGTVDHCIPLASGREGINPRFVARISCI